MVQFSIGQRVLFSVFVLVCLEDCGFWVGVVAPFGPRGSAQHHRHNHVRTPCYCPPAWPFNLNTSFVFLASEGSAISPMSAAALGLPSRSYFALGRGAPLFGCALALWLFVCCCPGTYLAGLLLWARCAAAVSLPSSGGRAGFSVCRFETKSGGLFMAQGFVTVFSRTSRVFSLVRLVVRKATSTTANSRLRNHSANLPSLQKAWRK